VFRDDEEVVGKVPNEVEVVLLVDGVENRDDKGIE